MNTIFLYLWEMNKYFLFDLNKYICEYDYEYFQFRTLLPYYDFFTWLYS